MKQVGNLLLSSLSAPVISLRRANLAVAGKLLDRRNVGAGFEQITTRIELDEVRIASDRYGGVDTGASNPPDHEEVTFVFEKITVTWLDGNITAEDDWETPVG